MVGLLAMELHRDTKDAASAIKFLSILSSWKPMQQRASQKPASPPIKTQKRNKFLMSCVSISQAASTGLDLYRGALNIKQFFSPFLSFSTSYGLLCKVDPLKPAGLRDAKKQKTGDVESPGQPGRRTGERRSGGRGLVSQKGFG